MFSIVRNIVSLSSSLYRMEEELIETEVDALRKRLLENLATLDASAKHLKTSDTHGRAAAKKAELEKMARALGTRSDYTEGAAFDREKQEEQKQQRAIERAERDRLMEEERAKRDRETKKWEAVRREKDRLRRRQEDQQRQAREERERMPPPPLPDGPRRRDINPSLRSRIASPPRRIRSPPSRRSRSPLPRKPRSPIGRRTRSPSPRRMRSPLGRRTRSPPGRRTRSPPGRRTRSPPRYKRAPDSRSPPRRRPRSPDSPPPRYMSRRPPYSPPPRAPRDRRSLTPPPSSRRLPSRSPSPKQRVDGSQMHRRALDSPPPKRVDSSLPRRVLDTPPRGTGFGERIVDDRSPDQVITDDRSADERMAKYKANGSRRSLSPNVHRRSASRSSSGSAMSVSGSED